jgi:hypothetical protein
MDCAVGKFISGGMLDIATAEAYNPRLNSVCLGRPVAAVSAASYFPTRPAGREFLIFRTEKKVHEITKCIRGSD